MDYSVVACGGKWIKPVFPLFNCWFNSGYVLVASVGVLGKQLAGYWVRIIDGVAMGFGSQCSRVPT